MSWEDCGWLYIYLHMQLLEFDESKAEGEEAGEENQDDKSEENKKVD